MSKPKNIRDKINTAKAKVPFDIIEERPGIKKARGAGWRFVHDGSRVITPPFFADAFSETGTRHTAFIGNTKQQCMAEIKRLKLSE